jgi:hypothetical protein
MASKIVLNDLAPSDAGTFSIANYVFETPHETTDPGLISEAHAHPWLDVEVDESQLVQADDTDHRLSREDDAHSALNSEAFDPEAIERDRAKTADVTPLAVQADLDQGKAETVGEGDNEVAVTLAADESEDAPKSRSRRRSTSTDKDKD